MSDRARFIIQCYPDKAVAYGDPKHPRHTFQEDWESAAHPRFDFERIQRSFENLLAKGYTVHVDPCSVSIHSKSGEVVFQMELSQGAASS